MTDVANPEVLLFASTTQSFLEKEASLSRLRELHEAGTSFEPDWWRRAAELGWTSLLVPEELGGGSVSGDGVQDLALVAELAGRTVAPGPLHPVSTVLAGLVEAPENHEETIESLVSGELVASWAVYEPGKSWSPLDATVTATPTATGFRLDGVKDRVEAGAESGILLVVARCDGAVRQFLVPTDTAGVRVEPQRSVDLVKRYARVHFDGVEVDASAVVGSAEQTEDLIARQSQIAHDPSVRRDRRHPGHRAGLHHPVGIRPAFVRPPDWLVSGTQTQVRRSEDLVRGLPRHDARRGRRGGCAFAGCRYGRERGEILCG